MSKKKAETRRKTPRPGLAGLKTARGKNGLMSTGMIALVVAIVVVFNVAVSNTQMVIFFSIKMLIGSNYFGISSII